MTTEQPRIPGVRYRRERRVRQVPKEVMGDVVMVDEEYDVQVPIPPVDLDRVLLRFVITVAVGMTAVAVVWSTASIGALLALVVTPVIAYAASVTFELAWVTLLSIQWLLRSDPERARPVAIAGWFAVGIVVAAVVAHGFHEDQRTAGLVGGAVSVLAKGLWTVVLRLFSVKFSDAVAVWLRDRQQRNAAAAALLGQQQRLGGQQAYMTAVYGPDAAAGALATVASGPAPHGLPSGQAPEASAPNPDTAPDPSGQNGGHDPDPSGRQDEPATPPGPGGAPVPPPSGQLVSIASTVRTVLGEYPGISDDQLIERVKALHGDRPRLSETVLRYARKTRNEKAS
ncbi:hypothetical protein [Streptomyces sp. TRM68367]|uniref:hypothetical protein n=1 Tax=Streptomyces sp. TRM68367 TaxID=2758415 RepID=UPI00165A8C21|nr:hypothetical protein [Streptomyces sp. TRM68367]MBC9731229.1 hypothetical protein [Streptomyces sp. TRM68367]